MFKPSAPSYERDNLIRRRKALKTNSDVAGYCPREVEGRDGASSARREFLVTFVDTKVTKKQYSTK
jgi:hypothetical protein